MDEKEYEYSYRVNYTVNGVAKEKTFTSKENERFRSIAAAADAYAETKGLLKYNLQENAGDEVKDITVAFFRREVGAWEEVK